MKKLFVLLMALCLICCTAFAEEVNYTINMDAVPAGYTLEQNEIGSDLVFMFTTEEEGKPVYFGSVAFSEMFDGYTLNAAELTDEEKAQIEEMFAGDYNAPVFDYSRETAHGTDLIILRETDAQSGTVEVVTIWQGYFITIGAYVDGDVTDEMVETAIQILSDLWVVTK